MPEVQNPCAECVHFTPIETWVGYANGDYAGAEDNGCLGSCHRPDFEMACDARYVHDGDEYGPCGGEWYEYEGLAEKLGLTPVEIWHV